GMGDLTGTIIRSDKPLGVLSGHVRTAIPQFTSPGLDSKDHLAEMLFPTVSWGKTYFSVPFDLNGKGDYFKVTAINYGTIVTLRTLSGNTQILQMDNPGDFKDIKFLNEPAVWTSNVPFQIAQFMTRIGQSGDNPFYDPSMVMLAPIEQYVQKIQFVTPGNVLWDQYIGHEISLVVHEDAIFNLMFDGDYVKALSNLDAQNIPGTKYYWARLDIDPGSHLLECAKGGFSGVIYGYGIADSYAMLLGAALSNPSKRDTTSPSLTYSESCGSIDGIIKEYIDTNMTGLDLVLTRKDETYNYAWNIEHVTDTSTVIHFKAFVIDKFMDGKYTLEYRDKNSNGGKFSYTWHALSASVPNSVEFSDVNYNKKECRTFIIKNTRKDTLRLDSIGIYKDKRLKLTTIPSLPYTMMSGESVTCTLCFEPKTDTTMLAAELRVYFMCDFKDTVFVRGGVSAPILEISGIDFGKVLVGDTKCDSILIWNPGNLTYNIDSLLHEINPRFIYYTDKVLPRLLNPGDSIKIQVCFSPDSVGIFGNTITAVNDLDLSNSAEITGEGIAPLFTSINIDWGRRRIGMIYDTTVHIANRGTADGRIKFINYQVHDYVFDSLAIVSIDTLLIPNIDSLELKLTFSPYERKSYYEKANLQVDWILHPPVIIEQSGEGYLPEIATRDIILDTTIIYHTYDTVVAIIFAGGNEPLKIDSIYPVVRNDEYIEIDYSALKNLIILPGDSLAIPIHFAPMNIGWHELTIAVVHYADSIEVPKESLINIKGFCIKQDTLDGNLKTDIPQSIIACKTYKISSYLENTGNIDFRLDSLYYDAGAIQSRWLNMPILPLIMPPDSIVRYSIEINPVRGDSANIKFTAVINDTMRLENNNPVKVEAYNLSVNTSGIIEGTPGDTVSLTVGGKFENNVEPSVELRFILVIDRFTYYLQDESRVVYISDKNGQIAYPADIEQNGDSIIIKTQGTPISFEGEASWLIHLKFNVMLSDKKLQNISAAANSDKCFNPDSTTIIGKIKDVCIFDLRTVKLIANFMIVEIAPNPASDLLKCNISLTEEQMVDINIFNELGKKNTLAANLNLKKGNHSLIFELRGVPNGIYMLTVKSEKYASKSLFLIIK
ncbi:MAG: Ig-like protein, partial [Bacteroidota bacterium]|nr:Ig-like protein [Bacteroidota bacterium]